MSNEWQPVNSYDLPLNKWVKTKLDGEHQENICFARMNYGEKELEWVEFATGRTTITHSTFLPPTHWRNISKEEFNNEFIKHEMYGLVNFT